MRLSRKVFYFIPLTLFACGEGSTTEETAIFGELKTTVVGNSQTSTLKLNQATCTNSKDSGLLTAVFTGESQSRLELRIKGFSSSKSAYTCAQSPDNRDGDIGERFVECMVEFSVPDVQQGTNTYAMSRGADTIKDFTYSKSCSISTQFSAPKLTFTVVCADMIQTYLQGAVRNPIDPAVTGSIVSGTTFSCNI